MPPSSWLTSLALAACFATSAQAETKFNLQASADRAVQNDTMTVILSTENDSADSQALYALTNNALSDVTAKAKGHMSVKLKPASRRMLPVYSGKEGEDQKLVAWRERADLQLESKSFPDLYSLVEEVLKDQKATLQVSSINFSLSDEATQSVGDELYATALKNIKHKASVVGEGLGKPEIAIDELSFNGPYALGGAPVVMFRAKAAAMSAPSGMESGESKVRVDLSGSFKAQQGQAH